MSASFQVAAVAKQLGVDAVPALVGFGRKHGVPVPDLVGVLVARCHAPLLRDAHAAWQHAQEQGLQRKRATAVQAKWAALVHKLLTRARLRAEYGEL